MPRKTFHDGLKWLERTHRIRTDIRTESRTQQTLVTIELWDTYQNDGEASRTIDRTSDLCESARNSHDPFYITKKARNEEAGTGHFSSSQRKESANKSEYPLDFEEFWKQYPVHTGKGDALKAWLKIKPDEELKNRMAEAIAEQQAWRDSANGAFRPDWKHPATWLNKKCWEDEIKTQPKPATYGYKTPAVIAKIYGQDL